MRRLISTTALAATLSCLLRPDNITTPRRSNDAVLEDMNLTDDANSSDNAALPPRTSDVAATTVAARSGSDTVAATPWQ